MASFRIGLLLVATLAAAPVASGQSPAVNTAYAQLPTTWDGAAPPMVEPVSGSTTGGPSAVELLPPTQNQTAPWPAPTQSAVIPASCIMCGDGCSLARCDPSHSFWFGVVELTVLQPSYSNGLFGIDDDQGSIGPRIILGWESARGLGFRTRFWGLGNDSDLASDVPLSPDVDFHLAAGRFDFDVYRRFSWDGSSLAVGASITSAHLEWDIDPEISPSETGAGVGFLVEGRHQFYESTQSRWAVVSRGRWAAMVGEWEDLGLSDRVRGDANMEIFEAALGLEYRREFAYCDLVLQYLIEAQAWDTTYVEDVNFLGSTASLGINW